MGARVAVAGLVVLGLVIWVAGQTSAPTSAAEQFRQKLLKLDANSAEEHYTLGEWAFKNSLYGEAVEQFKAALALDPAHLRASILLKEAQTRVGKPATQVGATPPPKETGTAVGAAIESNWLVSQDDIYRIRVEEVRPDEKLSINLRNGVVERFIKKWRGKEEFKRLGFEDDFRTWTNSNAKAKAVDFMREKNPDDTDIKDDILVQEDPKFMVDFRTKVWPILAANCATPSCHGGGDPKGGLRLFNVTARNERIDYTNFVLLNGLVYKGRRMIDRGNPEMSLMAQYLLPEELSQFHHSKPLSPPPAASRRDIRYVTVIEWLRSLHRPSPDYRLTYKPPLGMTIVDKTDVVLPPPGSTSAPATKPS